MGARNAVVGVDLGCTGDDALLQALRLLDMGAVETLHLLYVIDPKARECWLGQFESEERALAAAPGRVERRAHMLCRLHRLELARNRIRGHARIGEPAGSLLQMCTDYDAELLIVGTHGRRGLDRVLDGSVAEAVLRRARCPVLIARRKDYTGMPRTLLPDPPYAEGEAPTPSAPSDLHTHASTTLDSWHPSDNGPTGFRIV
jgi:nucleotide-binding universal stress UspA family protein